ncbi:helix-turn-helix domain-containing protein [Chryseobacterium populi]|uniref:DNA-binding domain-containing protein, AraC-type n=1 Tax=Chryseobacterium populi TaxID=1144316 RepID=J2T8C1_9FLAO|nr:AraC family transcriptional regulator [Chryseobacterium populi]EJL74337.1 DNA-binding domain-containing protein, AraC-type [Chryseobacterium populi]
MISEIGVFDIVIIVGAIQGAVGAGIVGTYPSNSPDKKLLSAILIALSLLNFKIIIPIIGFKEHPALQYFPLAIDTLIQPLIYLYTCSLTEKNFAFNERKLWYFLPVVLFQFHAIVVYVMTVMEIDFHIKYVIAERYLFYNTVKLIEDIAALFSAAIYWYLSFKKTASYREWLFMSQSSTQYSELTWLRNLLIGTGILGAVLFLSSVPVTLLGLADSFAYVKVFYSYLTILIYFLTFRGYQMLLISDVQVLPLSGGTSSNHIAVIDYSDAAEEISGFDEDFSLIQSALMEIMEKQQLFMEPELSLKEISKIIGFPAGQVSAAINAGFGKNFRTWVNSYRVEEVKKRLDDPRYKHLNLTGIAFDCGFNSEASFYRIFRQYTGYSPKSFMQSIQQGD